MVDAFVCAYRELARRHLRTLANVAGYFCGSAFIVAVLLLLNLELNAKDKVVNYMGTHFMIFSPAPYADDAFVKEGKVPIDSLNEAFFAEPMVVTRLLPKNFADKIRQIPEVRATTPFLLFRFKQAQNGHVFSVGGLDPADQKALKGTATTESDIISGVFFRPQDRKVVLVDESYALMWNLKVGSMVNIADALYPIIGIVRPGVRPVRADIYMNWPDAEEAINKRITAPLKDEANIFLVETNGLKYHATALKKVEDLLDNGIISSFNCSLAGIESMGITVNSLKLIVTMVFILVLLFAVNSQWISVSERRHDIAILKAIGWKNASIFRQIIAESFIQAVVGCLAGAISGYIIFTLFSWRMSSANNISLEGSQLALIMVTIFTAFSVLGVLAGIAPAIKAVKTSPAEVLRST